MAVAKVIQSPTYARAPDGPPEIKRTKMWLLSGVVLRYRNAALMRIKADRNVRAALLKERLAVASAYAARRPQPSGGRANAGTLEGLGQAFGVDLGGLGR